MWSNHLNFKTLTLALSRGERGQERGRERLRRHWEVRPRCTTVRFMSGTTQTAELSKGIEDVDLGALLNKVEHHHPESFEILYDATCRRMYSLALRITGSHELTEEVVGDLYLQVWRQAVRYDSRRGAPLAWLTVLCRSRALDALRHRRATAGRESVALDQVPEETVKEQPEDILEVVQQQSAVHAALAKLEVQQRQLLALAYFRGYSHSELAVQTGLPLGTVKTQVRRSMALLKEYLSADGYQREKQS